jgi:hypothetical protein
MGWNPDIDCGEEFKFEAEPTCVSEESALEVGS